MLTQIQPESDLLHIVVTGKFSLEEAKRTFLEILDAVAVQKSKKVLIDGRALVGKPEVIERFYYGQFIAELVISHEDRGVPAGTPFPCLKLLRQWTAPRESPGFRHALLFCQ